ncbi:MAG: PIN domain-containing protein [Actinobacteria bacterium]|nr:PIN domain-containing protein [Actinomycetota bacterium]
MKAVGEGLLLDASVWVASWSPEEQFAEAARELVVDTRRRAAALDLTLYEVANAIGGRRRDAVGAAKACRSIELRCRKNLVRVEPGLIEVTAELSVEHGLTAYDAAYVAVARRYDWQLVSTDVEDLVSRGLAITPDAAV